MALSVDYINNVWQVSSEQDEEVARTVISPAWTACIQHLVTPMATNLYQQTSMEGIYAWIASIPPEFREFLQSNWNPNLDLAPLKESILFSLTKKLVEDSCQGSGYATVGSEVKYEHLTLTPWSPLDYMKRATATFFGIPGPKGRYQLPVSVTVNGNIFTHLFNFDQAAGLLLFSKTAGVDFHITIFGAPFTYFVEGQDDLYLRYDDQDTDTEFSVRIGARRYWFHHIDFLQGFATGALWVNVDHHRYWSNLRDQEGQVLTF
jgi:hypothetical protein